MAESPPRSDTPGFASGDDLNIPRVAEDADAPAPWGRSRPWWSADSDDGTGPQGVLSADTGPHGALRDGSGAHPVVYRGSSGAHPVVSGGSGGHPVVYGGSGAHPVVPDGSGAHPVVPGGSGVHPVVPDGTGPPPVLPGQTPPGAPAPAGKKRFPRLLLVAGAATVGAAVLMAGVLAFRMDDATGGGGAGKDARDAGGPVPTKVINAGPNAGGLRKDARTPPQASAAYPFVAGAVEAGGIPAAERGRAVYGEGPGRPVNVLFMGGTGPIGDPAAFLRKVRPTTFIAGQDADPGRKGGRAVCGTFAVLAETHTFCAWATRDSYGIVASNRATLNPRFPLMAEVMRRIRNDVEKPR